MSPNPWLECPNPEPEPCTHCGGAEDHDPRCPAVATTPEPVAVLHFPKRCPHCREPMSFIPKLSCSWLQCSNATCPFWLDQDPFTLDGPDPAPYRCAFTYR